MSNILWIGYGHQDPTLDRLITEGRQILGLEGGYALARRTPDLERRLRNARITPIWLDSHDDLPGYLQSLTVAVGSEKTVFEVVTEHKTSSSADADVVGHKMAQALNGICGESVVWRTLHSPTRVHMETSPATLATFHSMVQSNDPEALFLLRNYKVLAFDGLRLHWERSSQDGKEGLSFEPQSREGYAVLVLKGEFDTFYCPALQQEVEDLLEKGVNHIALDMRQVKFIGSTALGAIIKSHKRVVAGGGALAIAEASKFSSHIIAMLGIDKLVPTFSTNDAAIAYLMERLRAPRDLSKDPIDSGKVLVSFPQGSRAQSAPSAAAIVGHLSNVDDKRIQFRCSSQRLGMAFSEMSSQFLVGTELSMKFELRLARRGYFSLIGEVSDVQRIDDESLFVTAVVTSIAEEDRVVLRQFGDDMAFLKQQLRETDSARRSAGDREP